jgi:hypothetical protein
MKPIIQLVTDISADDYKNVINKRDECIENIELQIKSQIKRGPDDERYDWELHQLKTFRVFFEIQSSQVAPRDRGFLPRQKVEECYNEIKRMVEQCYEVTEVEEQIDILGHRVEESDVGEYPYGRLEWKLQPKAPIFNKIDRAFEAAKSAW